MNWIRSIFLFLGAALVTFVFVALASGVGGFAATRSENAWVYPVTDLFGDMHLNRLTEKAVQRVFEDLLQGVGPIESKKRGKKAAKTVRRPWKREKDLARHFVRACRKHKFDPAFILSLIAAESGFRADAVSAAGAIGLMQLMPATGADLARRLRVPYRGPSSLKDPFINLTLGISYLAELRKRYDGLSPYFHVAAYNLGPARLDYLRAKPGFKPTHTLKYYEGILKGVDRFRSYSTRPDKLEAQQIEAQLRRRKLSQSVEKSLRLKDSQA